MVIGFLGIGAAVCMKFECQSHCGKCCTGSGFVYLSKDDAERIATKLHWSPETFKLKFCDTTNGLLHLKRAGNSCIFLDGWKCLVQEFKPTQCRTFPFWPGNSMERIKEWCPGIGAGREYSAEEILALEDETTKILPGHQLIPR